ncbi:MAG: hypothetical protein ACK504_06720 [Bacteroidota bacterium]
MNSNENKFNEDPNLPFDKNERNSFGLPLNYFESFEKKIKQKLELEAELQEYPLLNSIQKVNTFSLPKEYFSSLETKVDVKYELLGFEKLQSIKPKLFFPVDAEYEESFKKSLISKIAFIEELREFSLLNSLEKINLFSYPNGYFENLASEIKEKIHQPKISVFENIFHFIFSKKMALSFSIMMMALFTWLLYPKNISQITREGNCKTLACLEKQEILNNQKIISSFDEDQLIELVNLKKLDKQLNTDENSNIKNAEKDSFLNNTNLDEIIDEL